MGNILGIGEPTLIIGLGLNASFSCGQFLILLLLNIGCFAKLVEFSSLYGKNPQAHNDPDSLKYGNRPLFRGLFLKPNCDQIGQKCLKFYFWTRQKTFQTWFWKKKKFRQKWIFLEFFGNFLEFFGKYWPKMGQKMAGSRPTPLHLLQNFVRISKMPEFFM